MVHFGFLNAICELANIRQNTYKAYNFADDWDDQEQGPAAFGAEPDTKAGSDGHDYSNDKIRRF